MFDFNRRKNRRIKNIMLKIGGRKKGASYLDYERKVA